MPVLETDDGTYLTECLAICRYLEFLQPEPHLFGTTPRQEALILMWANIVENDGLPAIAEVLRNLSPDFRIMFSRASCLSSDSCINPPGSAKSGAVLHPD